MTFATCIRGAVAVRAARQPWYGISAALTVALPLRIICPDIDYPCNHVHSTFQHVRNITSFAEYILILQPQFDTWHTTQAAFIALLEPIPPDQTNLGGVCGAWGVKQIVAHLAGWQREAYTHAQHQSPPHRKTYDADDFNAKSVAALSLLNWAETLATFRYTSEDFTALLTGLDDTTLQTYPLYGQWLDALAADIRLHHDQIETWLAHNP